MPPAGIRNVIEISIEGQTLLQVGCAFLVFTLYLLLILWLVCQLITAYRGSESLHIPFSDWLQDNIDWTTGSCDFTYCFINLIDGSILG